MGRLFRYVCRVCTHLEFLDASHVKGSIGTPFSEKPSRSTCNLQELLLAGTTCCSNTLEGVALYFPQLRVLDVRFCDALSIDALSGVVSKLRHLLVLGAYGPLPPSRCDGTLEVLDNLNDLDIFKRIEDSN